MLRIKLKKVLLIVLSLVFKLAIPQQNYSFERRFPHLSDFGHKTLLTADSGLMTENYLNVKQTDLRSLAFKKKDKQLFFNLEELSTLVERYLVYEKRFVRFGMIPPKIKIAIKEKSK